MASTVRVIPQSANSHHRPIPRWSTLVEKSESWVAESSAEYNLPAAISGIIAVEEVAPLVEYERMNSESRPASGMFREINTARVSLFVTKLG
jgi:hypothetical protein